MAGCRTRCAEISCLAHSRSLTVPWQPRLLSPPGSAIKPPAEGASLDALRKNQSQSSSANASPSKGQRRGNGVWDSLFQYEITLQGGGGGKKKG